MHHGFQTVAFALVLSGQRGRGSHNINIQAFEHAAIRPLLVHSIPVLLPFLMMAPLPHPQIDSIPPNYPCPNANSIRNAYQSVPAWTAHLAQHADLKARLDATLGTAGLADWASWCESCRDMALLEFHEPPGPPRPEA